MDYSRHHNALIERARQRPKPDGYVEQHHVQPRCLGGCDEPWNLVWLTPEEHYVAHQLLTKLYPESYELAFAAIAMSGRPHQRGNKSYGWLRRRFARLATGRKMSDEARARMSEQRRGRKRRPHSAETRAKMSAASKGRPKSAAHCAALSAVKMGKKLGPNSPEVLAKRTAAIRLAMKTADRSRFKTPEYRAHQSLMATAAWARRNGELAPRLVDTPTGG